MIDPIFYAPCLTKLMGPGSFPGRARLDERALTDSEKGSYLRLVDFFITQRVIEKKRWDSLLEKLREQLRGAPPTRGGGHLHWRPQLAGPANWWARDLFQAKPGFYAPFLRLFGHNKSVIFSGQSRFGRGRTHCSRSWESSSGEPPAAAGYCLSPAVEASGGVAGARAAGASCCVDV